MWKKLWVKSLEVLKIYLTEQNLRVFTTGLGVVLLATQLGFVCFYLHTVTDTQGVIRSIDTDAGAGIETAIKTQLYNDNGWRSYGPTSYRIVRMMNIMAPSPLYDQSLPKDENIERQHHFLLLLSSYLALVALCLLISAILFEQWGARLLSTAILTGAFCASWLWTEMILRVHPDHLFALTTAIATLLTWKFYINPQDKKAFAWAAAGWALAASTKLTLVLFAPALLVFFYPFKKENILPRLKTLFGIGLLVYLVIGFPQSIHISGIIKFLWTQKRNVLTADWEFLKIWFETFAEQLQRAPLALLVLVLFLPVRKSFENISVKKYFIFAGFFMLPTLALLSRKITVAHEWYAMPFISSMFITASIGILILWNKYVAPHIPKKVNLVRNNPWYTIAMFMAIPQVMGVMPSQMDHVMQKQMNCRIESREVAKKVNAVAATGAHVLADPYIPYSQKYHDKELLLAFEMSPQLIQKHNPQMIALKSVYYRIYLPPEEDGIPAIIQHIENWDNVRTFYRLFHKKNETVDPFGTKWVKTYSDACSWELWEKAK